MVDTDMVVLVGKLTFGALALSALVCLTLAVVTEAFNPYSKIQSWIPASNFKKAELAPGMAGPGGSPNRRGA